MGAMLGEVFSVEGRTRRVLLANCKRRLCEVRPSMPSVPAARRLAQGAARRVGVPL